MVPSEEYCRMENGEHMEEKTFKLMGSTGAINIAFGIISIVAGTATGVMLIISGAKLLSGRKKIIF